MTSVLSSISISQVVFKHDQIHLESFESGHCEGDLCISQIMKVDGGMLELFEGCVA
jgi:hypothetical protein